MPIDIYIDIYMFLVLHTLSVEHLLLLLLPFITRLRETILVWKDNTFVARTVALKIVFVLRVGCPHVVLGVYLVR